MSELPGATTAEAQAKAAKNAQAKGGSSTLGKDKGLKVGAAKALCELLSRADLEHPGGEPPLGETHSGSVQVPDMHAGYRQLVKHEDALGRKAS